MTTHTSSIPALSTSSTMMARAVFWLAVAVHQSLQRQRALVFAGGGDDGFLDLHRTAFVI
jgi:hypothetical protein